MSVIQNAIAELLEPVDFDQLRGAVIEAGGDVFKESFTELHSWTDIMGRWTVVASTRTMILFRGDKLYGLAAFDQVTLTAQNPARFRQTDPLDRGIL